MRRRTNRTARVGLLVLAVSVHSALAQAPTPTSPAKPSSKPPASAAPGKPTPTRRPATAARPAATTFVVDGAWTGTSSNGTAVTFTIKDNTVFLVKFSHSIPSRGCFVVPELNNTLEVEWGATSTAAPRVENNRMRFTRDYTDRSPDLNATIRAEVDGVFSSNESFAGTIAFTAIARGACITTATVDVTAKRTGPAVIPTIDGEWSGSPDGRQKLTFSVASRQITSMKLEYVLDTKGCLPVDELRGTLDLPYSTQMPAGWLEARGTLPMPPGEAPGIDYRVTGRIQRDGTGEGEMSYNVVSERRANYRNVDLFNRCSQLLNARFPLNRAVP